MTKAELSIAAFHIGWFRTSTSSQKRRKAVHWSIFIALYSVCSYTHQIHRTHLATCKPEKHKFNESMYIMFTADHVMHPPQGQQYTKVERERVPVKTGGMRVHGHEAPTLTPASDMHSPDQASSGEALQNGTTLVKYLSKETIFVTNPYILLH